MKRFLRLFIAVLIFVIISMVIFLLMFSSYHEYSPAEVEKLKCSGYAETDEVRDTLTLVSWNIGYGGLGSDMDFFYDGGERVRPDRDYFDECHEGILKIIKSMQDVDFFLLQEVDKKAKRSYYHDQVESIGRITGGYCGVFGVNYNVKFVPVPLGRPMGKVVSGIMTLSRFSPEFTARIALPGRFPWPKRLFMLNRCITYSRFAMSGGKHLVVINVHNSAFDETGRLRREEMGKITELISYEYNAGHYVIAGGDWNMNPPGFNPGLIVGDSVFTVRYGSADSTGTDGWQWVWDPQTPTNRDVSKAYSHGTTGTTILDFFLLSPNIELLEVRTDHLEFLSSDHNPVTIKVVLKRGQK